MGKLDLSKINVLDFPASQYYQDKYEKSQIYLHHTASGRGVDGDYRHWLNTPARIATCVIIDYTGLINQCFPSSMWSYHLGIKSEVFKKHHVPYKHLDKTSIGIEIDAWGGLKFRNGKWWTYVDNFNENGKGKAISEDRVVKYSGGFKGYDGYERYTKEQIESTRQLLIFWNEKYDIPLTYNEDMWDVSVAALSGERGIWTHNSVRSDKSDIHPQSEMIQMLKTIASEVA